MTFIINNVKHFRLFSLTVDDAYLLQFLRVRKYNMNEVFLLFERLYLAKKRYPKFLDFNDADVDKALKLFTYGYCYPLPGRDAEGRKILLVQTQRLDPDKFSPYDGARLVSFMFTVLMEEEESQIAGVRMVLNHENATLRHAMPPMDFRDFMNFTRDCATFRQKGMFIMNLPAWGTILMEIFMSILSEKLRKRICLVKNNEELKDYIDPAMLPPQYGGTKSEAAMMEDFIKLKESKKELLQELLAFEIDWSKVPKEKIWGDDDDENVGSFRKLEID